MSKPLPAALGAVFLCTLLSLPASAYAQQEAQARPGDMRQRMAERPFSKPTERAEARLAYIRTALKITARQQQQWDAYASFVRKYAKEMEDRRADSRARRPAPGERPNAIERLERRQSMYANAVVRLNEQLAVQKPLYAALTPEQQKVADVVLAPRFGGRPGAMGRMGMGGRMGEMGMRRRG